MINREMRLGLWYRERRPLAYDKESDGSCPMIKREMRLGL